MFFSVFIFPLSAVYSPTLTNFSAPLRINTQRLGQLGEGEETGARMWTGLFWQNRFHGCFMLHRPLVFCLAVVSHNVNLKQGGFGAGVLI